jgi:hypothetical protein
MPQKENPLPGIIPGGFQYWKCKYCGKSFMFIDEGEWHEKECDENPQKRLDDQNNSAEWTCD